MKSHKQLFDALSIGLILVNSNQEEIWLDQHGKILSTLNRFPDLSHPADWKVLHSFDSTTR